MVKHLLLFWTAALLPVVSFAQFKADRDFSLAGQSKTWYTVDEREEEVADIPHFLNTGAAVFTAPLGWDGGDWLMFGAVAGGTGALFFADEPVRDWIRDNYAGKNYAIFKFDEYYGDWPTLLISAGIYSYGFFDKDTETRQLGLKSAEAFIYSVLAANLIKPMIGRSRPDANKGNTSFDPFTLSDDNHSIPSGHTAAAFAFSAVMADAVDNVYWDILWYGAAALTGASRVYNDRHWVSDVFAGAALGYFIGHFVAGQNWYLPQDAGLGMNVAPLRLTYTFVLM